MKTYKGLKGKAIKLHSLAIRSVGYCEAETWQLPNGGKCSYQLQPMHIISRRFNNTVTDTRNGISGCAAHHRYFTDHPRDFSRFISDMWAAQYYDQIYWLAHDKDKTKVDWQARIDFLNQIIKGEITLAEARERE